MGFDLNDKLLDNPVFFEQFSGLKLVKLNRPNKKENILLTIDIVVIKVDENMH